MEKAEAARKAGVTLLVIGRPEKPEGVPLADAIGQLETFAAEKGCDVDYGLENNTEGVMEDQERKLYLAGIGMGGSGQMTLEVQKAIRESEVLFGAPRMLKSLGALADGKKLERIYAGNEIASWLETHPEHHQAVVVYSGDTGFYSGARQLLKIMAEHPQWKISVLPGISTVSYLCSKLKRSWESVEYRQCPWKRVQDFRIAETAPGSIFAVRRRKSGTKYLSGIAGTGDGGLLAGSRRTPVLSGRTDCDWKCKRTVHAEL